MTLLPTAWYLHLLARGPLLEDLRERSTSADEGTLAGPTAPTDRSLLLVKVLLLKDLTSNLFLFTTPPPQITFQALHSPHPPFPVRNLCLHNEDLPMF